MLTVTLEPSNSLVEPPVNQHMATYVLFRNIKNASQLKKSLMKGELEAALLKPSLIYNILQVTIATNRALRSKVHNRMSTRSVYAEILYNMSPNKKISDALLNFGFGDEDEDALAVIFSSADSDKISSLKNVIDGDVVNLEDLKQMRNEDAIKKIYKLSENEPYENMLGSILGRMACKEFPV